MLSHPLSETRLSSCVLIRRSNFVLPQLWNRFEPRYFPLSTLLWSTCIHSGMRLSIKITGRLWGLGSCSNLCCLMKNRMYCSLCSCDGPLFAPVLLWNIPSPSCLSGLLLCSLCSILSNKMTAMLIILLFCSSRMLPHLESRLPLGLGIVQLSSPLR